MSSLFDDSDDEKKVSVPATTKSTTAGAAKKPSLFDDDDDDDRIVAPKPTTRTKSDVVDPLSTTTTKSAGAPSAITNTCGNSWRKEVSATKAKPVEDSRLFTTTVFHREDKFSTYRDIYDDDDDDGHPGSTTTSKPAVDPATSDDPRSPKHTTAAAAGSSSLFADNDSPKKATSHLITPTHVRSVQPAGADDDEDDVTISKIPLRAAIRSNLFDDDDDADLAVAKTKSSTSTSTAPAAAAKSPTVDSTSALEAKLASAKVSVEAEKRIASRIQGKNSLFSEVEDDDIPDTSSFSTLKIEKNPAPVVEPVSTVPREEKAAKKPSLFDDEEEEATPEPPPRRPTSSAPVITPTDPSLLTLDTASDDRLNSLAAKPRKSTASATVSTFSLSEDTLDTSSFTTSAPQVSRKKDSSLFDMVKNTSSQDDDGVINISEYIRKNTTGGKSSTGSKVSLFE